MAGCFVDNGGLLFSVVRRGGYLTLDRIDGRDDDDHDEEVDGVRPFFSVFPSLFHPLFSHTHTPKIDT